MRAKKEINCIQAARHATAAVSVAVGAAGPLPIIAPS